MTFSHEDLKLLLDVPFNDLKKDIYKLQKMVSYYRSVFGLDGCLGCTKEDRHLKFYQKLTAQGLQILENMENSNFSFDKQVISGVPLHFGSHITVTRANLTDELALEMLDYNANRISLFEKFPKDWKDKVAALKEEKAKAPKAPAKKVATAEVVKEVATAEVVKDDAKAPVKKKDEPK